MFGPYSDYLIPLLKVLDGLPKRMGRGEDILPQFETQYHHEIPDHAYHREATSGKMHWVRCVYNIKQKAQELGLVDSPSRGLWRLTEYGHKWLMDHPEASHFIDDSSSLRDRSHPPILHPEDWATISQSTRNEFFNTLRIKLEAILTSIVGSTHLELIQRSNFLQIRLAGFSGCHYEIILRRDKHEIALHFESSPSASEARLEVFESYIEELNRSLEIPIQTGKFGNRGWTQVWIECTAQPLSQELAHDLSDQTMRFIATTYPVLKKAYSGQRRIRKPTFDKEISKIADPVHAILDREIDAIRVYLQGHSALQPEDEKLCDWVSFCYTFELYVEGVEIFSLVNPESVQPWYFERTKKIARLCALRAKNQYF